jgi:hypothetical protein
MEGKYNDTRVHVTKVNDPRISERSGVSLDLNSVLAEVRTH